NLSFFLFFSNPSPSSVLQFIPLPFFLLANKSTWQFHQIIRCHSSSSPVVISFLPHMLRYAPSPTSNIGPLTCRFVAIAIGPKCCLDLKGLHRIWVWRLCINGDRTDSNLR
ncbi:unnamed protein product, partial [Linum tenue]